MNWLKSKFVLIGGAIISFLLLYVGYLKNAALRKEVKQQKAVSKGKDKANEALVKGVENESKKVKRGYFSDNPK